LRAASRRESARTEIERKLAKLGELAALVKSMVMRAARDKYEAEAKQRAQQRPDLPPNFKVDFMGRVAPR
jgi:hypothetical protein